MEQISFQMYGNVVCHKKISFIHIFLLTLLQDSVLHKRAWVAALLGTHLRIQDHKKVKFSGQDISSLAVKGLREE